jgi:hypothetical protein
MVLLRRLAGGGIAVACSRPATSFGLILPEVLSIHDRIRLRLYWPREQFVVGRRIPTCFAGRMTFQCRPFRSSRPSKKTFMEPIVVLIILLVIGLPLACAIWLIARSISAHHRIDELERQVDDLKIQVVRLAHQTAPAAATEPPTVASVPAEPITKAAPANMAWQPVLEPEISLPLPAEPATPPPPFTPQPPAEPEFIPAIPPFRPPTPRQKSTGNSSWA